VSRRLHGEIWAPLEQHLPPGIEHLIIVPDGILHALPFETLQAADSPSLLDSFGIAYVPSATVLAELLEQPPAHGKQLLLFADPPARSTTAGDPLSGVYEDQGFDLVALPFTTVEATAIADLAGAVSEVYRGAQASESRFKGLALERFGALHFATHALLSERSPLRSALLLAPGPDGDEDGFLQAREIATLPLRADLVVLSGCQSARGRILGGEGVLGLSRAFFWAGARSVVASLWNVSDRSTASFMESFYRHLAGGLSKTQALRRAKLDLRSKRETAAPWYWAAFVLLGDGTGPLSLDWANSDQQGVGSLLAAIGLGLGALLLLLRARWRRTGA
jgi:CHAT domain-containing protein